MIGSIRFSGTCPTCGRNLNVPIELLNKLVQCHGCGAEFQATGAEVSPPPPSRQSVIQPVNLDLRVDSLLAAADRQLEQACLQPQHGK